MLVTRRGNTRKNIPGGPPARYLAATYLHLRGRRVRLSDRAVWRLDPRTGSKCSCCVLQASSSRRPAREDFAHKKYMKFSRRAQASRLAYSSIPALYTSLPESGRVSRVVLNQCVENGIAGEALEQQTTERGERGERGRKYVDPGRHRHTYSSRSRIHSGLPVSGAICRRTPCLCASYQASWWSNISPASLLRSRESATENTEHAQIIYLHQIADVRFPRTKKTRLATRTRVYD